VPKPKRKDLITTIQLEKETRDFLRKLVVHADEHNYEALFSKHIVPLLKKAARSDDPVKIGEWFLRKQERAPEPPTPA
jgi:hypothetical protein